MRRMWTKSSKNKSPFGGVGVVFISLTKEDLFLLSNDVGQKRHKARSLDRLGKRALVGGGKVGTAARHYLAVRVEKLFDSLSVLVVDADKLRCIKIFFHNLFKTECRQG